ncbi:MAG TPA: DNA polymerase [Candidatus Paceibacterota bacterium]
MAVAHKKRLVILDTHAILHRAYHALPDFASSKGEPTGALYGLISMLVRILSDLRPDYVVATFDLPKPTHRHAAYEAYKAGRKKAEDDLVAQIIRSRDVISAFGIPRYEHEGFEADDVIGTIVENLKKDKDIEIIIASGDMDTMQLVDGTRVKVYTLKKGINDTILYDEAAVKERYGFAPELIADYKGLRGDPSDNIPGVAGVGEKTATELIARFGGIDDIYKALKKDPKKLLDAGIKQGMIDKLTAQEEEARFSKMLADIRRDAPVGFTLPEEGWKTPENEDKAVGIASELEFRSLIPRIKAVFEGEGGVEGTVVGEAAPEEKEEISEEEVRKAALAVWVLDSSATQPTLDDVYRAGGSKVFDTAKKNILATIKKNDLSFVYESIELPLMPVLDRMQKRGILVDKPLLSKLSVDYHKKLDSIAARVYQHAGSEFNINSPRQLGGVLFDTLSLTAKNLKKTAAGARSTRESELEKMRDLHPIIGEVLAYREVQKLLSTYIDSIPELLDEHDRLHTTFIQTGTTTGRLASQEPNLQNIPIKSDLGRAIRDAFRATDGFSFISFDYSQIELRLAAILSGDETLCDIFRMGGDVHAAVAARIFGVDQSEVTHEQRRRAKVINFGILYGMGVNALREGLGTTRKEAQEFHDNYFAAFPRLAAYVDETKADAARTGYTTTMFGRRRYFEGIRSPIQYVRAAAERMAINAPLQGSQADIIKLAMIRIDELFRKEGVEEKAYMLLQVHDELLFEIDEKIVKTLAPKIRAIMEEIVPEEKRNGVPIIANGKSGMHWGAMENL